MELKILFACVAIILMLVGYYPYLKDLFLRKTQPHLYTWLIWAITATIASAGVFVGGGDLGVLPMLAGTIMVIVVCLLSTIYGSKNITRSDTITLLLALAAIVIWIQVGSPLIAVLLVTAIDAFGYIPTFRKTYQEPWTETSTFWLLITISYLFTILASSELNMLTTSYLITIGSINILLFILIHIRRKTIEK
jgi:hypothetical protein